MKRILIIPVPYEFVKCQALISKTQKMTTMQKYLSALIATSNKSDWALLALDDAIETKLGIKKINQFLIDDELKDLFANNFKKKMILKEAFKTKVALLDYSMVYDVKKAIIENSKFILLLDSLSSKTEEMLIPLFNAPSITIKYLSEERINYSKEKIELSKTRISTLYGKDQKVDIFSGFINKKLGKHQVIKEVQIKEQGKHVYVNHTLELEINHQLMKVEKIADQELMQLIKDNKIKINIDELMNKAIDKLELQKANKESQTLDYHPNKLELQSHKLFDTKFSLSHEHINLYYYDQKEIKYQDQTFDFRYLNVQAITFSDFLLQNVAHIDNALLKIMTKEMRWQFTLYIFNHKLKVKALEPSDYVDLISYPIYQALTQEGKKFLLKSPFLRHHFLDKSLQQFDKEAIVEFQSLANESYDKVIKIFNYQYSENDQLFDKWEDEKTFYMALQALKSFKYKNEDLKAIEALKIKITQNVSAVFKEQNIWKKALSEFDKQKVQRTRRSKEKIIVLGLELRQLLEQEINKLSTDSQLSFRQKTEKYVKPEIAQKLVTIWKFLSENIAHRNSKVHFKEVEAKILEYEKYITFVFPLDKKHMIKEKGTTSVT